MSMLLCRYVASVNQALLFNLLFKSVLDNGGCQNFGINCIVSFKLPVISKTLLNILNYSQKQPLQKTLSQTAESTPSGCLYKMYAQNIVINKHDIKCDYQVLYNTVSHFAMIC